MIIKNFEQLATSSLRRQLLSIAGAGYGAINTAQAVKSAVKIDNEILTVKEKKFDLKKFRRIFVLAFGKAALESSDGVKSVLGDRIFRGIVIDVAETTDKSARYTDGVWTYFKATHPSVSQGNVMAAKETLSSICDLKEDDLVICSISGGGSAIFELPFKMDFNQAAQIFKAMTKGGASISELNTVRKHTSLVKGGQLARHFYPASVINLVFSDVPGDDLSVIASGPLVMDKTTSLDARALLARYEVLNSLKLDKVELVETPKEQKYFDNVENFLVVSPRLAIKAMSEKAEDLGWDVKIFSDRYEGESRVLAGKIIQAGKKGVCLLGCGESTVKILGHGKGGRNQEMALAGLLKLNQDQVFGCFASDGHDFTDCAGAIVDNSTLTRAQALKLSPVDFLNNNDSFTFFDEVGDHVQTGLTGSNIADFFVLLN